MKRKRRKKADSEPSRPGIASSKDTASYGKDHTGDMIIVGIGASAGGLDALQKLFPGLPAKAGMAFVIVQHMAPKYQSRLPSLLAKHTDMSVETITDGVRVEPDTIYITPPNKNVFFSDGRLMLKKGLDIGPKPSIDSFFNSLAEDKMAHAVGIILSGTGTDGAHGIRAIKSNDGIAMAQTPDSARFDGMPKAAIETGLVDLVLPPEKIGEGLQTARKYPHLIVKVPVDKHLDKIGTILELVHHQTGVDYREYKKSTVHRRISRRMAIHQLEHPAEYVSFIQQHPEECIALSKDMLISVTGFFRDAGAFESLALKLRKLFGTKQMGDPFRAWVPGCSTGEEAYSIAILIADILGEDLRNYRVQIFATDVDEESIQLARKAVYPVAALADTDATIVEKFFSNQDNAAAVNKQIRDMVVLARQDLIKDTNFIHLDLISCRNLLIYINNELQDKLLSLFHFSLNSNGLLFLGKSESIGKRTDLFRSIDSKWKIFQRRDGPAKGLPELMKGRQISQLTSHRTSLQKQQDSGTMQEGDFFDSLLGMMDCCAVLTDEEANIQYIRGDVSAYFKLPQGSVKENLNAMEMARSEFRFALRSMIYKANKENTPVTSNIINFDTDRQGVIIRVGPIQRKDINSSLLIVFSPVEPSLSAARRDSWLKDSDHERIRELEQELAITREHLQDTIEELETSTEELQSLNEELQAANEELQATNEELETSNEELQASNEELNTVNDELRAKSEEATEYLDNLTASEKRYRRLVDNMNEALMVCEIEYGPDKQPADLVIQQVNRALEKLMALKSRDLPLRAGAAQLHELVSQEVLDRFEQIADGGNPQRFEITLSAIEKELTLSIYNVGEGRLGAVCRDDTERKRFARDLAASEKKYRELIETANSIILRWDNQGIIRFINDFGLGFFGYSRDELLNQPVMSIVPKVEKSSGRDLDELVKDIVVHPEQHTNVPSENLTKDGRTVWVVWTNKAILDEEGKVQEILAIGSDITSLKETEAALQASEKKFRNIITNTPVGMHLYELENDGTLRFIEANPAADKILGVDNSRYIGQPIQDAFPNIVQTEIPDKFRNIAKNGGFWHKEDIVYQDERISGAFENFNFQVSPGQVASFFVDITERKNAEVALRRSAQFPEENPNPVLRIAVDGTLLYQNAAARNRLRALNWKSGEPLPEPLALTVKQARGQDETVETELTFPDGLTFGFFTIKPKGENYVNLYGIDLTDRKRFEKMLRKSEERIRASLAEKDVLLKEIHHRVKNNMQVISSLVDLQTAVIEDDAMKEMLEDIKHRVRSMALVHEKLYQAGDLANVEFSDYAKSLLNYLWHTHKTEKLNVKLDTALEPIRLPVTKAVPCGLILNELVSNAFNHAFKGRAIGKVSITLRATGNDKARLTVRDDGIGLPSEQDWRQTTTLGLRLVQMLAKQLGAAVDVNNDSGTEFKITFERPKL